MSGYFLSLFFGTFLLEDVALAASLALLSQQKITWAAAFAACFLGISIGDMGLYFLGRLTRSFAWQKKFPWLERQLHDWDKIKEGVGFSSTIVLSRLIPGTRLPTYLGAGFLNFSFWRFFILTVFSVFLWVSMAFVGGESLRLVLTDHWIWMVLGLLLFMQICKGLLPRLMDPWQRKALPFFWRRFIHFEFWSPWIFYLPIAPRYIYLSLKYGSWLLPFYAHPKIENGGLIGESKWEFLRHLKKEEPSTLATVLIAKSAELSEVKTRLQEERISFPFVMKPDVGQRGFAVRIVGNENDLRDYLSYSPFARLAQSLSLLPHEAGIFYIRDPRQAHGDIFSITDKLFPKVVGDGHNRLGDLILQDKRARLMAHVYFLRWREHLDEIPAAGRKIVLTECGNHCQGAIFLNGKDLKTPALEKAIDQIAQNIPNFYFGRLDIRYKNKEDLKQGKNFEIVEINGASSEATHIWDSKTSLREAYQVLYKQWDLLFLTGLRVKTTLSPAPVKLISLARECLRVAFRKSKLSISS